MDAPFSRNVCGTLGSGLLAQRFPRRKPRILAAIYAARSALFALIALNPTPSVPFALAVSSLIGLLWLSTVPVTNAIVTDLAGPRYVSTLFAIIFANHQVGSFFGAYLGGKIFDAYGSYEPMWWVCSVAGVLAALDHLPIDTARIIADDAAHAPGEKGHSSTALVGARGSEQT